MIKTNESENASATAEKIAHTLLFEISTRGYPLYEGERIIGYHEIKTSYQAVPENEVEAFLETYANRQEDSSVKCICNNLPLPFAAAPELLEVCKLAMEENERGGFYQRSQILREIINEVEGSK